jgi:hypothetical protein
MSRISPSEHRALDVVKCILGHFFATLVWIGLSATLWAMRRKRFFSS